MIIVVACSDDKKNKFRNSCDGARMLLEAGAPFHRVSTNKQVISSARDFRSEKQLLKRNDVVVC